MDIQRGYALEQLLEQLFSTSQQLRNLVEEDATKETQQTADKVLSEAATKLEDLIEELSLLLS